MTYEYLMNGDKVMNSKNEVVDVTPYLLHQNFLLTCGIKVSDSWYYDWKPIPLTINWAHDLGFRYRDGVYVLQGEGIELRLEFYKNNPGAQLSKGGSGYDYKIKRVDNVHDLQQWIRKYDIT